MNEASYALIKYMYWFIYIFVQFHDRGTYWYIFNDKEWNFSTRSYFLFVGEKFQPTIDKLFFNLYLEYLGKR